MTYPELIRNKIAVFAIDFSGHGESEGRFEDVTVSQAIDDLKSALDYIETKRFVDKGKVGVLGSSYGGIASIFTAVRDKRIKVLALKAPAIDFRYVVDWKSDAKMWKKKGYVIHHSAYQGDKRLNYSYYLDGLKYNALKIAKELKIPTMVIVGEKDTTVSTAKVREFFDLLTCEKEFHLIGGANHWFSDKESKELFGYSNSWFKKWLK